MRWPGSSVSTARRRGGPNCCTPRPWPPRRPPITAWRRIAVPRRCGCSGASSGRGGRRGPRSSCCAAGSQRAGIPCPPCCGRPGGSPPGWMSLMPGAPSTLTCSPGGSLWRAAGGSWPPATCASLRTPGTAASCALAASAGWPRPPGARPNNAGGACWPRATAACPCSTCTCGRSAPPSCARWPRPTARRLADMALRHAYAGTMPGCS